VPAASAASSAFAQDHRGQDLLVIVAVGHAHHRGIEHRQMGEQHLVDLARSDVFAALDDPFLQPPADVEVTV
jgi:hypothetical protein